MRGGLMDAERYTVPDETRLDGYYCHDCGLFVAEDLVEVVKTCENCNNARIQNCIVLMDSDVNYEAVK